MGIASAIMTVLILVLSEIIPKTLGASHWRRLAPAVARILGPLIVAMWPFVKLSRGLSRMLGRDESSSDVRREEVSALAELGAQQGVIGAGESAMVRNLLVLHSLRVEDIMTPRTVVFALSESETVGTVMAQHPDSPFSRIPVYRSSLDDVSGYVLRSDVLLHAAQDRHDDRLATLRRELGVVSEKLPLPQLFDELLRSRTPIALVVDEYGGTAGVVTLEDLLETLIGMEIVDEADRVANMQELARRHWEERARPLGLLDGQQAEGGRSETERAASRAAPPEPKGDEDGD